MATKLHGRIALNRIPKELIQAATDSHGNPAKYLWIDIVPNKNGADQYGNTHAVTLYNGTTRETIYLGNLKPQEFGKTADTPAAPADPAIAALTQDDNDLPF